jgi:hypothetical protein
MQNQEVVNKLNRVLIADRHQSMLKSIRSMLVTTFDVVLMAADETSLLDSLNFFFPTWLLSIFPCLSLEK